MTDAYDGAFTDATPIQSSVDSDPYASAFPGLHNAQARRDQDIQLKANLTQSVSTDPNAYARQRKTADYLGYPVAAVEALPVQTQQQAQVQQVSDATHDTPIARQAYADPDFAKLAHDDSHNLAGIERTLGAWGRDQLQDGVNTTLAAPRGLLSSFIMGTEKQLSLAASTIPMGIDAAASAVAGKPVTAAQDWWFKNTYDEISTAQEFQQGLANKTALQRFLFAGGSMAGILGAATVTGGESVALGADAGLGDVALNAINHAAKGMVIPSTSAAIQTGKDVYENTGSPISALHAAGMEYLTNTLGGVVPLSAPGGVASRIAQSMASGAIVSELSRQMMNGSLPSDMQQGFDVEGAVINSLTSGILGVGGPHGESSLQHSIRQVYADATMAGRSADTMQRIGALSELAGKSELRNRDPEAFHALVDKMTDSGDLPEVFVSGKKLAEVLNQSGVTDAQFSDMLPDVAKQMHEAAETDGDVRISTADYATHISGGPVDEALQPHLKADSDGMTMAEGQAFYQKLETNLKERADKIVAGHQDLEAAKADSQSVHDDILRQLTEVNRFPDSVNKVNAALARDYYTTMADRMGMKPSEMYAAHPLNVESLMKVGWADVLSQGDASSPLYGVKHSDLADQIQAEHPGLRLDIMGADGSNSVSLSRIVVPKESRKTGIGSSVMQRLLQWADANGKTITLSPSDSFGATSTGRLKDFYRRFGFVENKGKNKDFTTSDSMYRKPVSGDFLHQRSDDIGQQLKDRMAADHEGVKAEYAKLDGAMGGRLLNTDIARELSPGYRADRTRSADVHDAASGFIKRLYAEKLKEPTPKGMDKTVMFTAGGTGAGKTTGMDAAGKSLGKPEIIYDTNMNTLDSSVEKIEQAFAAGRNVKILYTYRDPVDAFRKGALPRADRMEREDGSGRTVPISEHVRTHVGSSEVMRQLDEKYREDPRFAMDYIDNSRGKGNARVVLGLADLPEVVNNNLHEQLTEEAHQAHKAGEISAKVRDGFLAKSSRDSDSKSAARDPQPVQRGEAAGSEPGSDTRAGGSDSLRQDAERSELSGRPGSDGSLTQGSSTRGAYSPDTRTISLGKESDLSTFPHELAHHFLEMTNELARSADAPEAIRSDMDSLLRWFGESGDTPEDRLANWNDRTLEEKRDSHEKFAEGFEKYLFEGKAPTVELQPMFARLRSWMLSVYKSLDNMGVQINDEVRGVFDRMIASEEAIKRAEQVRGYESLFKTAEDAGMTDKQFADYQAIGKSATDAAVTDMTAKSLADMKWVSRAKSKFLRGMQREAASQRRETRIEARRQVLSQPVYRAWQFLTAKMGEADGVPSSKAPVSGAMPDPSRDSMFEAIGKIGGLNKKEVVSTWGVDEKHAPTAGAFKKAVWKSEGGKSIDSMAESLMELGYLPHDEHGKWDIRDFEDKFHSELSGNKEYSVHHDYEANREKLPGEHIDREQIQAGRFDRNSVPADLSARLDSLGMLKHDSIHPDIVAELFGYSSGQELMRDITRLPDPHTAIENLTDQMMLQEHGELTDPQAIERAAEQAIHNEARAKFMATGLKVLTKSPIPANQIAKAAKEAADAAIAAKQVKDLRPLQYTAAEAKANRETLKLVAKDPAAAVASQRAALLNNRLARSAADAVTEIQKGVQYLARFSKPSLRAKVDVEYRDQIDALLGRFDLRQNVPEGPARAQVSLDNWVRSQVDAGYSPAFTADMLDQSVKMHYKDLTVEQFRGLVDGVKTIEHIGREQKVVTIDGKRLALDTVVGDLTAKMQERGESFTENEIVRPPKWGVDPMWRVALDFVSSKMRGAVSELVPQQFKANRYDMHEILGPFKGYIFNRVFDANYHKIDMLKGLSDEIRAKVDESLGKEWQKSLLDLVPNKTLMDNALKVPGLRRLTRGEMLGIARHVGNESNFEKLTKGMGWNPADVWAFLHDNMTEKDWKATQITWDAAGKYWPEMEAMNRRLGNTAPDKVEPRAITTKFGEFAGGYAPIDYDPLGSKLAKKQGEKAAINPSEGLYDRSYYRADTTTNGSLNSRVSNYFDFIDLGYHSVERRMHDTVHDLAYREALIDTNKIISNEDFRRQFQLTYGPEQYKSLQQWLGQIANAGNTDEKMSMITSIMSSTRRAVVANGIAFRVSTMLKHGGSAGFKTMGYFSGGGEKFILSRMAAVGTDHAKEVEGAIEKFAEIRARALQQDRDYRQTAASIFEPESIHGKAERFGHSGVAFLDFLTAVPTAWAAYDRAITEGIPVNRGGTGKPMEEHEAVAYANSIVREAHGSNIESSRSMLMANPSELVKTMTTLHGFMNNTMGQQMDMADKFKIAGFSKPEILSRYMMAMIVPAVWAGVLGGEFGDNEPWWKGVEKSIAGEYAGCVPMVRDAYHALEGYHSAGMPPWMSAMGALAKPIHDVVDVAQGKEVKHPIKDLGNSIGLFIPGLGQIGTSAQYLTDVVTGKEHPKGAGEFLKGTAFGARH